MLRRWFMRITDFGMLTYWGVTALMAFSYWIFVRDFDPNWWIPNLFLMIWPLPFLYQLMSGRQSK